LLFLEVYFTTLIVSQDYIDLSGGMVAE